MKKKHTVKIPTTQELKKEIKRVNKRQTNLFTIKLAFYIVTMVSAISIILATSVFPVLRIYGNSMANTLENGDLVVCIKKSDIENGEIIAFYSNNKVLVKRVIASAGDWIDIDKSGVVFVNGEKIEEPYINKHSYGMSDIKFPYQVPDGKFFVMGDNRQTSVDSRNKEVGSVGQQQIIGKLVFRISPINKIKIIN